MPLSFKTMFLAILAIQPNLGYELIRTFDNQSNQRDLQETGTSKILESTCATCVRGVPRHSAGGLQDMVEVARALVRSCNSIEGNNGAIKCDRAEVEDTLVDVDYSGNRRLGYSDGHRRDQLDNSFAWYILNITFSCKNDSDDNILCNPENNDRRQLREDMYRASRELVFMGIAQRMADHLKEMRPDHFGDATCVILVCDDAMEDESNGCA